MESSDGPDRLQTATAIARAVRDAGGRILRVSHSSGAQVVFHRDTDGFVERITDPGERELHYGYDATGHLRTFHDREAAAEQFSHVHALTDLTSPEQAMTHAATWLEKLATRAAEQFGLQRTN